MRARVPGAGERGLVRAVFIAAAVSFSSCGSAALMAAPSQAPTLSCRLEADVDAGPTHVRFTLCNETDAAVAVLKWYTLFEGFAGDLFVVTAADGRVVEYDGPMVKRAAPTRDSYLVLPPRECQSAALDAGRHYPMRDGTYSVRFERGLSDVAAVGAIPRGPDRHRAMPLACGPAVLRVGK